MKSIDGILVVDKPAGVTSHDVILTVRKLLKTKKIGHTGTLDPEVTGVLPLCIGRATKLVEYLQDRPKTYIAKWRAGFSTDTEDATGNILEHVQKVDLTQEQVTQAFKSFIGSYEQQPPMYSAVKIGGKKLYELAREGKIVERPTRTVIIYDITIEHMSLDEQYPVVTFRVRCSKGTYIRTLCVDIGRALKVPAHMDSLQRIESAGFTLEDAYTLEEIEQAVHQGKLEQLIIPMEKALLDLPQFVVPEYMVEKILNGQPILKRLPLPDGLHTGDLIRILSPDGKLLALHKLVDRNEIWSTPEKILYLRE